MPRGIYKRTKKSKVKKIVKQLPSFPSEAMRVSAGGLRPEPAFIVTARPEVKSTDFAAAMDVTPFSKATLPPPETTLADTKKRVAMLLMMNEVRDDLAAAEALLMGAIKDGDDIKFAASRLVRAAHDRIENYNDE